MGGGKEGTAYKVAKQLLIEGKNREVVKEHLENNFDHTAEYISTCIYRAARDLTKEKENGKNNK